MNSFRTTPSKEMSLKRTPSNNPSIRQNSRINPVRLFFLLHIFKPDSRHSSAETTEQSPRFRRTGIKVQRLLQQTQRLRAAALSQSFFRTVQKPDCLHAFVKSDDTKNGIFHTQIPQIGRRSDGIKIRHFPCFIIHPVCRSSPADIHSIRNIRA